MLTPVTFGCDIPSGFCLLDIQYLKLSPLSLHNWGKYLYLQIIFLVPNVCSLLMMAKLALIIKKCNTTVTVTSSLHLTDRSLQPGNLSERGAAVSRHGHGWLGKPKGFAALSLLTHENGW